MLKSILSAGVILVVSCGLTIDIARAQANPEGFMAPSLSAETKPTPHDDASPGNTSALTTASAHASEGGVFFREISMFSLCAIAAGKVAEERANRGSVAVFASSVVAETELSLPELIRIADQKNVRLPNRLDSREQMIVKRMEGLSPDEFDEIYLRQMVHEHEKVIDEMEREEVSTVNADKRAFIQHDLPILKNAVERATRLLNYSNE